MIRCLFAGAWLAAILASDAAAASPPPSPATSQPEVRQVTPLPDLPVPRDGWSSAIGPAGWAPPGACSRR